MNGLRCAGYILQSRLIAGEELPVDIVSAVAKVITTQFLSYFFSFDLYEVVNLLDEFNGF